MRMYVRRRRRRQSERRFVAKIKPRAYRLAADVWTAVALSRLLLLSIETISSRFRPSKTTKSKWLEQTVKQKCMPSIPSRQLLSVSETTVCLVLRQSDRVGTGVTLRGSGVARMSPSTGNNDLGGAETTGGGGGGG